METGMSQFRTAAFYTKWLQDWRDSQESSGEMPHTAPQIGGGGGPAWGGISVVLPWEVYRRFVDRHILEVSYPSMQRWLAFLESKSSGGLLRPFTSFSTPGQAIWSFLGDWVPPGRGQSPGRRVDEPSTLFFNNCYWLLNLQVAARSAELLDMVGLAGSDKRIGGFSRGMKQRLGIAQALLGSPKLLICDEPTSALDPVGRKESLDILGALRGKTTVLFSTHILSDVERVCDRIAVLHGGKVALAGTLEEMRARRRHDALTVEFASKADLGAFLRAPSLAKLAQGAEVSGLTAVVRAGDILAAEGALITFLAEAGIRPVRLELQEPTLESLFMEAIK
jgi:ABC-type uncharacterized transport system ATPase subunit